MRNTRKVRGGLAEFEQRVLDGDVAAVRALVRQACGPNTLELQFRDVELRAKPDGTGGDRLLFTGYASVTEEPFTMWDWAGDYTEVVRTGAFTKTLSETPDVIFCVNHDWGAVPMARTTKAETLRLSEDETGLYTEADLDPSRADVHTLRSAMDAGELDAMSFAFYVMRQTWSPDYTQRDILEVSLDGGDTSVVTFPANPATTGTTALRAKAGAALARSRVPGLLVERARTEKRDDSVISPETQASLEAVLDLIVSADVGLDSAEELLSEVLGLDAGDDDESQSSDLTPDSDEESHSIPDGHDPVVVRERLRLKALAGK